MKVCHFSDWHGETQALPVADLYVCTGDMFPNFPTVVCDVGRGRTVDHVANLHLFGEGSQFFPGVPFRRKLDPVREEELQRRWVREVLGSYRPHFGSPDAPVVCVRGNHDFTDLSEAFGGDVWEVDLDPSRTTLVAGLKVGGCRGIPYIVGEWSDELRERGKFPEGSPVRPPAGEFADVTKDLPTDLELLVTHAPPYGVLDEFGEHYGSRDLNQYINERMYVWGKLRAHLFGHIHGASGSRKEGDILFSNAARTFITYEI